MTKRIVWCVVGLVIAFVGVSLITTHTRTESGYNARADQLAAEPYTPKCSGEDMGPGDVCVTIGGSGGSDSYEDLMTAHNDSITVDAIKHRDAIWKGVGTGAGIAGGLVALLSLYAVVMVVRSRQGRKAFAKGRNWTYTPAAATLLDGLNLPFPHQGNGATEVVQGKLDDGRDVLVFDYAGANGAKTTGFLLVLPAPVPRIIIKAAGRERLADDSSVEARAMFTPVIDAFTKRLGFICAEGPALMHAWGGSTRPGRAQLETRVDALRQLGDLLVAAAHQATRPQPPIPAQPVDPSYVRPFPPAPGQ
jgi:hypothetical protein